MTPSEFIAWFPLGDFAAVPNDVVSAFIGQAANYFDPQVWGNWYSEGLAYFVAHKITIGGVIAANPTDPGDTSSKHVSRVGKTVDGAVLMKEVEDSFMRTQYGQHYVEIRQMVGLGGVSGGLVSAPSPYAAEGPVW